jgi:gamma-carbonic anhydrase
LIGVGSIVLDHCEIQSNSIIAAGSVVPPNTLVPSGELWSGVPAKCLSKLTSEQILKIGEMSTKIKQLAMVHSEETSKEFEKVQKEMDECEYRDDKLAHYYYEGTKPVDVQDYPRQ